RDLKPGNILFAGPGLAEPYIADLGLAKLLDDAAGPGGVATATGEVLGTPGYMAPEQARGARAVGPPADVHALAAILYEALTGRAPYQDETRLAAIIRTTEQPPLSPRALKPDRVDRPLELVILKGLAKEPSDRYPDAAALAEDLDRWLDGRPVHAKPPTAWDRVRSAARRNPLPP